MKEFEELYKDKEKWKVFWGEMEIRLRLQQIIMDVYKEVFYNEQQIKEGEG